VDVRSETPGNPITRLYAYMPGQFFVVSTTILAIVTESDISDRTRAICRRALRRLGWNGSVK
jgi:hypothetical protein